uniref:Regucalcin n=1 Tax=Aquatica lateralis TaxID=7052 RepID=Q8TA68_AQULA|nr:luciferin-regenerating enzyme [Aquatica lateralis]
MSPVIEQITEVDNFQIGEGPHWDTETQSLYFVDILEKSIHKYVPSTKQHTKMILNKRPSFIIPIKETSDRFVISLERDICVLTWDGVSATPSHLETIVTVDTGIEGNTFNDGKADAFGNLWAGTLYSKFDIEKQGPNTGTLYSLSNKQLRKHISNIFLSNGLAWNKDSKKFYFIDSNKRTIDQFDYDSENLIISNCQPLFTLDKHGIQGLPDAQTIDENDNLWVAIVRGGKVINIGTKQPESLLGVINMPESLITSVCFGGSKLDELYVTTSGIKEYETDSTKLVKGGLYRVTGLGVKGLPAHRFSL